MIIVIAVYYLYLLPILCLLTASHFAPSPAFPPISEWNSDMKVALFIPLMNWAIYGSTSSAGAEVSLAIRYLAYWSLAGVPICGAVIAVERFARRERDRKTAKAQQDVAEAARLQLQREAQHGYRRQMGLVGEQSIVLFESLPKYLSSAEECLDQAEADFADGAFAPFWDSIENAAITLGRFVEGVHQINGNSSSYTDLIRKCEGTPPQVPLARQSVAKLGVGTATAERMRAIVRAAQRNFHFASIYEQRKTNQILVAGFTSLAQALERMTKQVADSIDDLTRSVDAATSVLDESIRAVHSRLDDAAESASQIHDELKTRGSETAKRESKALEMLDNIQRGRRPFI